MGLFALGWLAAQPWFYEGLGVTAPATLADAPALALLLFTFVLPLFAFLFLAGWDLGLLFAQLGNLADHYRLAEPVARHLFSQDLKVAFLFAAGGYALLRLPAFLRRLERRLGEGARRHD